jgi:hypothetical protein
MSLYLFSSEIAELTHLPSLAREEIVEAAVFSLPITGRGLLTFAGVVLPMTAVALALVPGVVTFQLPRGLACLASPGHRFVVGDP